MSTADILQLIVGVCLVCTGIFGWLCLRAPVYLDDAEWEQLQADTDAELEQLHQLQQREQERNLHG